MNESTPDLTYKRQRFPPAIIGHAVWLDFRFALGYRDVEKLLAERGVIVTYETVRRWCRKFGQPCANALRRRRPRPGDTGHLDEGFIQINGEQHYLWRAVDQAGNVLDILVQARRDKRAATTFPRRLLKGLTYVPHVAITDKRASYGAALRGAPERRAPAAHGAQQPGRELPPAGPWARAAHAAVHGPGARPTVLRGLRPPRQPLPPTPSPPRRP